MTAENRRNWIIVLVETRDKNPQQSHDMVVWSDRGKKSDLSSEEAGDPVPEVRLTSAAQEPETPPQILHSQRTTSYDGTRTLRVPPGSDLDTRTSTYSWCLSDITVKPHLQGAT